MASGTPIVPVQRALFASTRPAEPLFTRWAEAQCPGDRPAATGIDKLTAHEAQIARLARDGLTNPEIGARLFLSARTVQYHLANIFAKLGISSRSQLDRVLPGERAAV